MSEEEDDDGLQEVIDEFVAESYEGLDQIDNRALGSATFFHRWKEILRS